jgi:hypothetical protein
MPLTDEDRIALVDLNNRYVGAWLEVNTRIAQRQNALTTYIALSGVVTGVLFGWPSRGGSGSNVDPSALFLLLPGIGTWQRH